MRYGTLSHPRTAIRTADAGQEPHDVVPLPWWIAGPLILAMSAAAWGFIGFAVWRMLG